MANFPVDLTFYDRSIELLHENNGFPAFPEEDFLGLLKCDELCLYYLKTKKNGQYIDLDEVSKTYTWVTCHMTIPEYFHKVDIEVDTSDKLNPAITYLDIGQRMKRTYNGLFALAINQQVTEKIKSKEIDELLDVGRYSCAIPANNEDSSNNMDQLFFRFRNHYFVPIIMSTGAVVYYAFENRRIIEDWVTKAANEEIDHTIAIDAPVQYENILGIFYTKDARLLPE